MSHPERSARNWTQPRLKNTVPEYLYDDNDRSARKIWRITAIAFLVMVVIVLFMYQTVSAEETENVTSVVYSGMVCSSKAGIEKVLKQSMVGIGETFQQFQIRSNNILRINDCRDISPEFGQSFNKIEYQEIIGDWQIVELTQIIYSTDYYTHITNVELKTLYGLVEVFGQDI